MDLFGLQAMLEGITLDGAYVNTRDVLAHLIHGPKELQQFFTFQNTIFISICSGERLQHRGHQLNLGLRNLTLQHPSRLLRVSSEPALKVLQTFLRES
eukprot:Skav227335  [mRNA]  locus=scaffold624:35096:39084:+ [translate_table: standard]